MRVKMHSVLILIIVITYFSYRCKRKHAGDPQSPMAKKKQKPTNALHSSVATAKVSANVDKSISKNNNKKNGFKKQRKRNKKKST